MELPEIMQIQEHKWKQMQIRFRCARFPESDNEDTTPNAIQSKTKMLKDQIQIKELKRST